MTRQDRQGVRTPADIERKYQFGKRFAEVLGVATDAQTKAEDAEKAVEALDQSLTPEEIFNRLTNNGQEEAIYRDEQGHIYINASYIKIGELVADLIRSGILRSQDGNTWFDLDNGEIFSRQPCTVVDDDGVTVEAELALRLSRGGIQIAANAIGGNEMDRLRIGVDPMAPIDGSSPGATVMDGWGEDEVFRGVGITPNGNLWLRSENGNVYIGTVTENGDNITSISGKQLMLQSADGEVSFEACRASGLADPVEAGDAATKAYVDARLRTPWTDLTVAPGYHTYNNDAANHPKLKVTGSVVTVMGALSPDKQYLSSNTDVVIAGGIPAACCPARSLHFICQGSGMNRWTCGIHANGDITMRKYGVQGYEYVPTTAWLTFCVTYQI